MNALRDISVDHEIQKQAWSAKIPSDREKKILKAILVGCSHRLLYELFRQQIQLVENLYIEESYEMDSQIIQFFLKQIVETEEYTLEGIAYYTRIPLDVIYDAAAGLHNQLSVTLWARVIELFMQVYPEVARILIDKLLELKNNNETAFVSLLREE